MAKIAIITGASRGIGATTARLAARDGYDVCVNYTQDEASAAVVVKACQALGRRAMAARADVAKPEDVEAMFHACDEQLGPVTLLVNNAGVVGTATTVAELPDTALRETFEVNVYGSIYCARAAIRRMSTARGGAGGAIVNVSSIAANLGSPGEYVHYAASKGAIDSFTIGLAKEVGPEGIRVNAVQAGTTDTGIHAKAGNPDRPALVAKLAPLRRIAEPEDTAEAILYLASDKAGYATGAILRIGGGL
jgi:NAD(P)-dependent dehydrogenase (short-subunit alcohol dehydrogenase family)